MFRVLGIEIDPVQSELFLGFVFAGFDKAKELKTHEGFCVVQVGQEGVPHNSAQPPRNSAQPPRVSAQHGYPKKPPGTQQNHRNSVFGAALCYRLQALSGFPSDFGVATLFARLHTVLAGGLGCFAGFGSIQVLNLGPCFRQIFILAST